MVTLRSTYPHAVAVAGGVPVVVPPIRDSSLRSIYERLDGLILSGGGDIDPIHYGAASISPFTDEIDRERDEVEIQLARWAIEDNKPLLAICRGQQVLNVALGGTLIQDIREEVPRALRHESPTELWFDRLMHPITLVADSPLIQAMRGLSDRIEVNSLHHQAIKDLAPGLTITACADDGIIEGVAFPNRRFALGVQWHPEALVDQHPPMKALFESLVEAARA